MRKEKEDMAKGELFLSLGLEESGLTSEGEYDFAAEGCGPVLRAEMVCCPEMADGTTLRLYVRRDSSREDAIAALKGLEDHLKENWDRLMGLAPAPM